MRRPGDPEDAHLELRVKLALLVCDQRSLERDGRAERTGDACDLHRRDAEVERH
jgi:hypothetical protein